jgi:hypothetical protein
VELRVRRRERARRRVLSGCHCGSSARCPGVPHRRRHGVARR